MSATTSDETLVALAALGGWCLATLRKDNDDIDGGDLQDKAEQLGLLTQVEATEPCGEHCICASVAEFPMICYRLSEGARTWLEKFS